MFANRVFSRRFEVEVPARGPFGSPPSREETFSFVLPPEYDVVRSDQDEWHRVAHLNFGGLKEERREFSRASNGITLIWKLSNDEVFPVGGRRAFMDVEIAGKKKAQMELSDKYRVLRKRFFDQFYFDGLVAEWVAESVSGTKVKFADQTIYQGQALIALSTELPILNALGKDVAPTASRIIQIMDAIEDLDRMAGPKYGGSPELDGFFVRDNVTGASDPRLGGRFSECDSDWQSSELENDSPSGDQIFGLMFGLLSVVAFSGDASLVKRAKEISSRLFDYARRNLFILKLPNGDSTRRGSDMRWLSSLLHGLNKRITDEDLLSESSIEIGGITTGLQGVASFWDSSTTAGLIGNLSGKEVFVPGLGNQSLNAFTLHIIFMALSPSTIWSQSELEQAALKVNHHLSILLYCLYAGKSLPVNFTRDDIQQILDACPETGPESDLAPSLGWNKDNRWIRSGDLGKPSSSQSHKYNGLDWLILYNLEQILFVG